MPKAKDPPQALDRDLLTIKEAAAYLRVDHRTLWRMTKEGKMPYIQRLSKGRILIAATDIEKLLEKSKH